MLKIENIQTYYGNIQALKDVSIEINEGEIVALIGANGAGKTTTLMSICGITPPRYGQILLDGDPIHGISAEKIVQQGIVQVPEGRTRCRSTRHRACPRAVRRAGRRPPNGRKNGFR